MMQDAMCPSLHGLKFEMLDDDDHAFLEGLRSMNLGTGRIGTRAEYRMRPHDNRESIHDYRIVDTSGFSQATLMKLTISQSTCRRSQLWYRWIPPIL